MEVMIQLDDEIEVTSNGATVTFDLRDIPEDKRAELVAMAARAGFAKTIIDSASGAKAYADENEMAKEEAAQILMEKRIATFAKGDWGAVRGAGDGISPVEAEMISAVRKAVKASDEHKYKNADEPTRKSMCMAYLSGLPKAQLDGLRQYAETQVEKKREARAERDALAKQLGISL